MNIELTKKNESLLISLKGRLDANTSNLFEEKIINLEEGIKDLIIDMNGLEYISSAGLRVLLAAQKKMNKLGGSMVLKGAQACIKEIFEVTGFGGILTFED